VNCKRDLDDLGNLARSTYTSYFMKTIHYVPLEVPVSSYSSHSMMAIHYIPLWPPGPPEIDDKA